MPHPLRHRILLTLLAFASLSPLAGAEAGKLRVLVIGNSFSGNALHYLADIAKADGCALEAKHLVLGGSSLEVHWTMAEAALKDPADPAGRYGENGRWGSLPEALGNGPWDAITVQQQSQKASDAATYRPYIDRLVALLRERAPKARLLIHETWAYRNDDGQFGTGPGCTMPSAEVMYQRIGAAYATMAREFALEVIPSAEAFHLVAADPARGFAPDPAWKRGSAVFPALPDQRNSLNVGWSWTTKDGVRVLSYDPKHANPRGSYLAGCVWFESLFRRSVVGNGFVPRDLARDDAAYLQGIAHAAVAQGIPAAQGIR